MYEIIELQKNADGTLGMITEQAATEQQAFSVFHTKLAFAAISNVPVHSVCILSDEGVQVRVERFYHVPVAPAQIEPAE